MARTDYPLTVTGILRNGGPAVDGLIVTSHADVRAFIRSGPRLTDGAIVESGWANLVCAECGDTWAWCPKLSKAFTKAEVAEAQAAA